MLLLYQYLIKHVARLEVTKFQSVITFSFFSVFQAAAAKPQLVPALKRLVPLFDRVLVQRAEAITKTKGGIVIPEKAQSKVLHGTVVAIGPGQRNQKGEFIPLAVKVGDKVLLPEYGGTKVELEDNKEFHLFRESDILAKVE